MKRFIKMACLVCTLSFCAACGCTENTDGSRGREAVTEASALENASGTSDLETAAGILASEGMPEAADSENTPEASGTEEASGQEAPAFTDSMTKEGIGIARQAEAASDMVEYWKNRYITLEENFADIRWYDGSKMNATQKDRLAGCIPNITYNEETVFPKELEKEFPSQQILEKGKSPGLGVEALHEQGITGKGVGIAIIDQVLYTGHPEYASNLALYEEMHVVPNQSGSMHGAALASISVGKTCGVAPDATLYFWGMDNVKSWDGEGDENMAWEEYARVIERVIEVNRTLPENGKIRVIAISRGYNFTGNEKVDAQLQVMLDAIHHASDEGIFVITTSTELNYDFFEAYGTDAPFAGLGKLDPLGDPDSPDTYTLGSWQWESAQMFEKSLLVPMDGRTTADMSGDTYVYYADGGWSWTVPYIAGVYALCAGVDPEVTPEEFYRTAVETATVITRSKEEGGKEYTFRMMNPPALVSALQKNP